VEDVPGREESGEENASIFPPALTVSPPGPAFGDQVELPGAFPDRKGVVTHPDEADHPIVEAAQGCKGGEGNRTPGCRPPALRIGVRQGGPNDPGRKPVCQPRRPPAFRQDGYGPQDPVVFSLVVGGRAGKISEDAVEYLLPCPGGWRWFEAPFPVGKPFHEGPESAQSFCPRSLYPIGGKDAGEGLLQLRQRQTHKKHVQPPAEGVAFLFRQSHFPAVRTVQSPVDAGLVQPPPDPPQTLPVQGKTAGDRFPAEQFEYPAGGQARRQQLQGFDQDPEIGIGAGGGAADNGVGEEIAGGSRSEHRFHGRRQGVDVGRQDRHVVAPQGAILSEQCQEAILEDFQFPDGAVTAMDLYAVVVGAGGQTARPQILHVEQGALEISEERVTRRDLEFRRVRSLGGHGLFIDQVDGGLGGPSPIGEQLMTDLRVGVLPPRGQIGQAARRHDLEPVLPARVEQIKGYFHDGGEPAQGVQVKGRNRRKGEHGGALRQR